MRKIVKFFGFVGLMFISSLSYADPKCPNVPVSLGQCINIGSYELFMKVQGDKGPVVVFEAGRGNTSDVWDKVAPTVSQFAQVVTYDRVNLGFSQNLADTNTPVTAKQVAENLHTLLHTAKLPPPYVLVGHSLGGIYVQMFARLYPKEVSGVIFVDAASPAQTLHGKFPPQTSPFYAEALGTKISQQQVNQAPSFPKVPIIVLTATYHGFNDPTAKLQLSDANGQPVTITEGEEQVSWEKLQNQLAKLSPYSTHMYAYDSDHPIQTMQPNLVVDAIYTIIKQQKKKP